MSTNFFDKWKKFFNKKKGAQLLPLLYYIYILFNIVDKNGAVKAGGFELR